MASIKSLLFSTLLASLAASASASAVLPRGGSAEVYAWSQKVCGSGDRIQAVKSTYGVCYDIYKSETAYCMSSQAGEAIGEPSVCVYANHGCSGQHAGPASQSEIQNPHDTGGAIPILSWKIASSC